MHHITNNTVDLNKKDPRTPRSGGGSRMLRGLMLRMRKFPGRVQMHDGCKVTTKKGRQKIEGQLL